MMKNDMNISTTIVVATFEYEYCYEEVSGEKVWR